MVNYIKISSELTIYSGDLITIRADNGTYLKRYEKLAGHPAIECYQKQCDDHSKFVVSVVGPNEIYLQSDDNDKFLKRYSSWKGMSIISVDNDVPDHHSTFIVQPTDEDGFNNTITLKFKDCGSMIKRYDGDHNRCVMVGTNKMDKFAKLTVEKIGTKCKEVVEDMVFDMASAIQVVKPAVIASQKLKNGTEVEQTESFKVNEIVATKQTFTWDAGFSLDVSTEFTVGVPLVAEVDTTIDVETHFSAGGTESSSDQKTFEEIFPVLCPPMATVVATATVQKGTINVNYIATVSRYLYNNNGQQTKYTYKAPGVFNSVNAFNLQCDLQQPSKL